MGKLNQVIAVLNGKKAKAKETLTEAYHTFQKAELFSGLVRTYLPRDDGGEVLPEERKFLQAKVTEQIQRVSKDWTEMIDATATQDYSNCKAKASVVVEGKTILTDVPVTHLLFLEKQLVDLKTFVSKIPTLDPAEEWEFKPESDCYASRTTRTNRTKKVPRNHVKSEATKEHPAQVDVYTEDVWVGTWAVIKFSGAIPAQERNDTLNRVEKLLEAVKSAREEANNTEEIRVSVGKSLLAYVFQGK
jgi:hypothetical protein